MKFLMKQLMEKWYEDEQNDEVWIGHARLAATVDMGDGTEKTVTESAYRSILDFTMTDSELLGNKWKGTDDKEEADACLVAHGDADDYDLGGASNSKEFFIADSPCYSKTERRALCYAPLGTK